MSDNQGFAFSFTVSGQAADAFGVVAFNGYEAINEPYRFDITLASQSKSVGPQAMVQKKATLQLQGQSENLLVSGVLQSFVQVRFVKNLAIYRAVLVPAMANLAWTQKNQIFLNTALPDMVKQLLQDGNINQAELRFKESYPQREYVCQFNESHLAFLIRWLEQRGAYFFFEQDEGGEKLVIVDSSMAHKDSASQKLLYSPPSNLDAPDREYLVKSLIAEHTTVPATLLLKDYNYQYPSLDLQAKTEVSAQGVGEHYIYGDSFLTQSDGENLARIRAQELACKEAVYHGESLTPSLSAGYTFSLDGHYDPDCNSDYLLLKVKHQGRNNAYLSDGMDRDGHPSEARPVYTNTFTAIPARTQYRPPRVTPKSRYPGMLTAKVDAAGSGQYAQLDEQGRYMIRMPFDLAGRPDGKASCPIRLAQPYAGSNYGMHFPLLKDAEVLISFVEADPDRPVIIGAIPNQDNVSVVQDKIQPMNMIQSASGNQVVMGDKQNATFLGMYHPKSTSGIFLGELDDSSTEGALAYTGGGDYKIAFDSKASLSLGTSNEVVAGFKNEGTIGGAMETNLGFKSELNLANAVEYVRGYRFEFGTYGYVMEKTRHYIASQGISMRTGLPESVVKLEEAALKSMATTAGASLAGAASVAGLKEFFSTPGLWKGAHLGANSITGGVIGGLLGLAAAGALYKQCKDLPDMGKKIDNAAHDQSVAAMDLNTSGISMKVKTSQLQGRNPKFSLTVGESDSAAACTSLTISDNGSSVLLNNKNSMILQFTGKEVILGTEGEGETLCRLEIKDEFATLGTESAQLELDNKNQTITLENYEGGLLEISEAKTTLAGPESRNSVVCSEEGTTISGSNLSIKSKTAVVIKGNECRIL